MRIFLLSLCLVTAALSAQAESAYDSPLIVVTRPKAEEVPAPKPTPAPVPATPASPKPVASPASPEAPAGKLWPMDTIPIFVTSCSKLRPAWIDPCYCIITKVMQQIGHDEFLKIDAAGAMETEPRLLAIRQQCVAAEMMNTKRNANPKQE